MKYRARNHIVNAERFDVKDVEQHKRLQIRARKMRDDTEWGTVTVYAADINGLWKAVNPGDYIVWTDDWRRVLTPDEFAAEFEAVGEEER